MAIRQNLIYGDVSANDYDVYIAGDGVYDAPARNVELVSVPGRNGSLIIDKGNFENITIEYPAFIFATTQEEFKNKLTRFINAIMSQRGYQRLSDTYHPDEYRTALYTEAIEVNPAHYNRAGQFTLKFNCKPQKYLTSGEEESTVTNGMSLINPTLFDSEPLIKLDGYGTVGFNGYAITVNQGEELSGYNPIWNAQSDTKNIYNTPNDTNLDKTLTATFDKSVFNTGDTFSFDAYFRYYGRPGETRTLTHTNNNATLSSFTVMSSGVNGYFDDTFSGITFNVGTARTETDTVTFTITDPSNTTTITFTVAYDGDHTVTVSFARATTGLAGNSRILRLSEGNGVSTITVGGEDDAIYVDCELGEAYTFNNGSVVSVNDNVALGSDLPKLAPGENTFTISNTFDEVKVIPRWWRL